MQHKNNELTAKLIGLIKEAVETCPVERGGHLWCDWPLTELATKLGVPMAKPGSGEKTVSRYLKQPRFYSEFYGKDIDGNMVRRKIIRVLSDEEVARRKTEGEGFLKTVHRKANEMRPVWLKRQIYFDDDLAASAKGKSFNLKKIMTKDGKLKMHANDHGGLMQIARHLSDPHHVMFMGWITKKSHWTDFAACAKAAMEVKQDHESGDTDLPLKDAKFWRYPNLTVIRDHLPVALELYWLHQHNLNLKKQAAAKAKAEGKHHLYEDPLGTIYKDHCGREGGGEGTQRRRNPEDRGRTRQRENLGQLPGSLTLSVGLYLSFAFIQGTPLFWSKETRHLRVYLPRGEKRQDR